MRIAISAFALLLAVAAEAQEMFVLSGAVTSPSGPLAGVPVSVRAREAFSNKTLVDTTVTTNASGAFEASVPSSYVDLTAMPPPQLNLDSASVFNLAVKRNVSVRMETAPLVSIAGEVILPGGVSPPFHVRAWSVTADRQYGTNVPSGSRFELRVRGDVYSIRISAANQAVVGRLNVDATRGDVVNLRVPASFIGESNPFAVHDPPRGDRISFSTPDEDGMVVVTGAAGAVEPLSSVLLGNVMTGHVQLIASRADGSFSGPLFAPAGSPVMVRHDPSGRHLPWLTFGQPNVSINHAPATLVHVPASPQQFAAAGTLGSGVSESLQVSAARSIGVEDPGSWFVTGTLGNPRVTPGAPFTLSGTLTIYDRDIETAEAAAALTVRATVEAEQVIDAGGQQRRRQNQYVSTFMTPSGLPIERQGPFTMGLGTVRIGALRFVRAGVVDASWTLDGILPPVTPPGVYRALLRVSVTGSPASKRRFDVIPVMGGQMSGTSPGILPMIRVGDVPRRLVWMLGLDRFSNGSRGAVALEDRGKVAISSKVMTNSETFVVSPGRMRLEPYLPLLSVTTGNGGIPDLPQVAFRFPSGSLTATVRKPDGVVETLGPVPFAQLSFRTPVSRSGQTLTAATNHVSDFHQLLTNDPRFDYAFTQWGRHVVTLRGSIEDIHGNTYDGSGTYEVDVARPLDLDLSVIPGTPFTTGDSLSTGVVVHPPVPANVVVTVRHYPDSAAERVQRTEVRGVANRFGHFSGTPVPLNGAGEFRVDVQASWTDPAGVAWVGSATWGSIVETPSTRLVARGRRGFDNVDRIQDQWLFVKRSRAGGDHLMFPFHSGDVMWMSKDDPAADIPKITVQDSEGSFAQRVRSRFTKPGAAWESPRIEERITAGEIPLFSTLDRPGVDGMIEQWGYFYAAVSRPGVRVREFLSEDPSGTGYWRFQDAYNQQLGNGINGDLPNDFKFQFGGAVWRDLLDGFRYYGAYASFFVLLPFNDDPGGRLFPPFQGNGGGPGGGPLFKLKGRDIDLFFHPTAVRPGSILERNEIASFTGYSAPTLPSKVEIALTSPSGLTRTIRGQANKVGYFFDPGVRLEEEGVWKAKVKITFDGITSAGQVTQPFPTGDVLGSREGEFNIYVVRGDAQPLEVRGAPASSSAPPYVRPADTPITFTATPPPGLTNTQLAYTTTMPGFILEEGTTPGLTYTYDAQKLAKDFPNLDLHDVDGFAGADTITISLLLSGTDASGARKHFARQIVIQGEELQMPEQKPNAPSRRRATR